MRKRGRRLDEDERRIRLLELIPWGRPGSKFNELVRTAKAQGFSKPTLWRHLIRFEKLGLVIHDGKFYRRDPLFGVTRTFSPWLETEHVDGHMEKAMLWARDLTALRTEASADWWPQKEPVLEPEERAKLDLSNPEKLFGAFYATVSVALAGYWLLLEAVRNTADFAKARELTEILMDAGVKSYLARFAWTVWECRENVKFEALDGNELKFTLASTKSGAHSHYTPPI